MYHWTCLHTNLCSYRSAVAAAVGLTTGIFTYQHICQHHWKATVQTPKVNMYAHCNSYSLFQCMVHIWPTALPLPTTSPPSCTCLLHASAPAHVSMHMSAFVCSRYSRWNHTNTSSGCVFTFGMYRSSSLCDGCSLTEFSPHIWWSVPTATPAHTPTPSVKDGEVAVAVEDPDQPLMWVIPSHPHTCNWCTPTHIHIHIILYYCTSGRAVRSGQYKSREPNILLYCPT